MFRLYATNRDRLTRCHSSYSSPCITTHSLRFSVSHSSNAGLAIMRSSVPSSLVTMNSILASRRLAINQSKTAMRVLPSDAFSIAPSALALVAFLLYPKPGNLVISAHNQSFRTRCRSEEHTSELQSRENLVCRLLLEKKKEY